MDIPKPSEVPVVTEEQRRETARILAKINRMKESPLKGVGGEECPTCGGICDYADDLTFEYYMPGGKITIANLEGSKCRRCGDQSYDLKSVGIIERQLEAIPLTGYEVSISKLGAGKLGMYFTKDLLRVMDLIAGEKAIATPVTGRRMVIDLSPPKAEVKK